MRWAQHVAHMERMKNACKVLTGRPKVRDRLEDQGVDGTVIVKLILQKYLVRMQSGLLWLSRDQWRTL
jgi:hypothetical protein